MIDPLQQKKIDLLLNLADRAGTEAEAQVARSKAEQLREKYTVPDPVEPKTTSENFEHTEGAEGFGFFYKEDGKEIEI